MREADSSFPPAVSFKLDCQGTMWPWSCNESESWWTLQFEKGCPVSFATRIHNMISLGLSIDVDEEAAPAQAESSDDAPPPLEATAASTMEDVD